MDNQQFTIPDNEIAHLRELAKRKLEIAHDPANLERKQAWYNYDSGENDRVMVIAEFLGIVDANKPIPLENYKCKHPLASYYEQLMMEEIYNFESLKDDHVIEPVIRSKWEHSISDFGVEVVIHSAGDEVTKGAVNWDHPIKDLQRDFDLLKHRTYTLDREVSFARQQYLQSIFDGIMDVKISQPFWWSLGMTGDAIKLIGLENLMLFMYDDPEGLHRLMAFLRDDNIAYMKWLEQEGLLSLNNRNNYTGSGSIGYTRDLPQKDFKPGDKVRLKDMWGLLESQETVLIGPDHFAEFVYPYQETIAREFGKVYYGCCEPVHNRWEVLKNMSHLSRVSVSPWCDEAFMSEALGRNIGYSRKPNPTLISTSSWNEDSIRKDLRKTLDTAKNNRVEIIMKDVHTVNNQPERVARWVEIAREEIART